MKWKLALKLVQQVETLQFALKTNDMLGFSDVLKETQITLRRNRNAE